MKAAKQRIRGPRFHGLLKKLSRPARDYSRKKSRTFIRFGKLHEKLCPVLLTREQRTMLRAAIVAEGM